MQKIDDARNRLVAEGRKVLFRAGYKALDVKKVAASSGIATGTFYNYFPGKKEFALAIIDDECKQRFEETKAGLADIRDARETLSHVAAAYASYREEIGPVFWQIPMEAPDRTAFVANLTSHANELAEQIAGKLVADGSLSNDVDKSHAAGLIASYLISEATISTMDFDAFYACLTSLTAQAGASSAASENVQTSKLGDALLCHPAADIYEDILDSTGRRIYVRDIQTHELLYANKPARDFLNSPNGNEAKNDRFIEEYAKAVAGKGAHKVVDGKPLNLEKHYEKTGEWKKITGHPMSWCGHDAFVTYADDITELKRAEQDAVEHRQMYEAAVEEAKLVVWDYNIVEHRVVMSDNEFTRYDYRKFNVPKVIENAPSSLVPFIADDSVDAFLDMYRQVDEGAPQASCEVWYKTKPGQGSVACASRSRRSTTI